MLEQIAWAIVSTCIGGTVRRDAREVDAGGRGRREAEEGKMWEARRGGGRRDWILDETSSTVAGRVDIGLTWGW